MLLAQGSVTSPGVGPSTHLRVSCPSGRVSQAQDQQPRQSEREVKRKVKPTKLYPYQSQARVGKAAAGRLSDTSDAPSNPAAMNLTTDEWTEPLENDVLHAHAEV